MQSEDVFAWIEQLLQNGHNGEAFEQLIDRFRRDKQYAQVFDARLMKKRLELGLPLVSTPLLGELPAELQQAYQDAYVQAAREVGELFLSDGNIPRAWTYFRALGDTGPISNALETIDVPESGAPEAQDLLSSAIHIAYQEGVNPRKGFELILKHYGICRAITVFSAYPNRDGRDDSLRLLVHTLHRELVENLKRAISSVEGKSPDGNSVPALLEGRDWLFENNSQHTDSSHIVSLLRLSAELDDEESLRLAVELADYGTHLGPMFQHEEDPPFDRVYEDRGLFLRALLGENVDGAVKHFAQKLEDLDFDLYGTRPAETVVQLLLRLERHEDAIRTFVRYLADVPSEDLSCPSLLQLCQIAGDFDRLKREARQQGDPLNYMAAVLQSRHST